VRVTVFNAELKTKEQAMPIIDNMLKELEEEAQTTRRVLERVPGDQLNWRPHKTARTLGELAMHVAVVPGAVAELFASPSPAQIPNFADPYLTVLRSCFLLSNKASQRRRKHSVEWTTTL
jgi:hypothetical protein